MFVRLDTLLVTETVLLDLPLVLEMLGFPRALDKHDFQRRIDVLLEKGLPVVYPFGPEEPRVLRADLEHWVEHLLQTTPVPAVDAPTR